MATARDSSELLRLSVGARVRLDGRAFTVRRASPPEFLMEDGEKLYMLTVVHGQRPTYAEVIRRPGGGLARSGRWVPVGRYSFVQAAGAAQRDPANRSCPTRRETPTAKRRRARSRTSEEGETTSCQALIEEVIAMAHSRNLVTGKPAVVTTQPTAHSFFVKALDQRGAQGGDVMLEGRPGGTVEGALRNVLRELRQLEPRPAAAKPKRAKPRKGKPKKSKVRKSKTSEGPAPDGAKPTVTTRKGITYYRNVKGKDRKSRGHVYPGEVQVGRHADVKPRAWVRIHGRLYNTDDSEPFDLTFRLGERAVHGAYNLIYTGTITSIGKSTVTIKGTSRNHRLAIDQFVFWNRRYDAERIARENADTMRRI